MKDFYFITIIGFFVGWLIFLPLYNIGIQISTPLFFLLVIGFTLLAPFVFFIFRYLNKFWRASDQFGKFAAVGTLNALLNANVVNLLVLITGITQGFYFTFFTILAFIITNISSYFWNKFFTFKSRTKISYNEYVRFLAFSVIGGTIYVITVSFFVNVIGAPVAIGQKLWINIAIVFGIILSFLWNFKSYKIFVFKIEK